MSTSGSIGGVWGSATTPSSSSYQQSMDSSNSSALSTLNTSNSYPMNPVQGPLKAGRVGGAASDGEYEKQMVLELCAPGGTRAVPPKDKLDEFVVNVRTLNVDLVGGIILDKLGEESWQVKSKALAVIEAIIKSSGVEDFKHFFQDNAGELEALMDDSKATVRDKAVKILRSLGISIDPQAVRQSSLSTSVSSTSATDNGGSLLDFSDDVPEPPAHAPASTFTPEVAGAPLISTSPVVDLFSGMSLNKPATPSTTSTTTAASPQGLDLFADLSVKGSSQPPPAPIATTSAPTSLLDDFGLSPPPQPQPTAINPNPTPPVPPPTTTSTGPMNDLLMLSDPLGPPQPQKVPVNNFDPLAGGPRMHTSPPHGGPPPNGPMMHPTPGAMPMGNPAYGPPRMAPPQGPVLTAGVAPTNLGMMGQGMIPALQHRTIIPNADEGPSSAFSFIGAGGPGAAGGSGAAAKQQNGGEDAFSFVKDAMKSST